MRSADPENPKALITGVTGQDGSYLADLLLDKGYRVVGVIQPGRGKATQRIDHVLDRIDLIECDLLDQRAVTQMLTAQRPTEVYNYAARASSSQLFDDAVLTGEYNGLAVARILEAIRVADPAIRFCQASSSEMFGNSRLSPQDEATPFYPRNPYGVAKLYAHWITVNYRETYGLFACSGILFNHESPRRGHEFVTRKITRAVARISAGQQRELKLGDLEARRDWGYAADYVRGMWRMLQAPAADDYVLATGEAHSVREFCEIAFRRVGLDYRNYVIQDSRDKRRPESVVLVGNAGKARRVLQWAPSLSFEQLVCMMVDADVSALSRETSA